jgi:hypothetical protein
MFQAQGDMSTLNWTHFLKYIEKSEFLYEPRKTQNL